MKLGDLRAVLAGLNDETEITIKHTVVNKDGITDFYEWTKGGYELVEGEGLIALQPIIGPPYHKRAVRVVVMRKKED